MTRDNVTDIVERLSYLHVWPQSIASTYADTLTPRQIERLYDVGNVATDAADTIATLRKQLENAREALEWIAKTCETELPLEYNDAMRKVFQRNIRDAALKGQPC